MKLEDQVAPLALAQRMKDLGFPQESGVAFWSGHPDDPEVIWHGSEDDTGYNPEICAAPTVAEMGEWLPGGSRFTITGGGERHEIEAVTVRGAEYKNTVMYKMPTAEALARFLIALAGSGALDPKTLQTEVGSNPPTPAGAIPSIAAGLGIPKAAVEADIQRSFAPAIHQVRALRVAGEILNGRSVEQWLEVQRIGEEHFHRLSPDEMHQMGLTFDPSSGSVRIELRANLESDEDPPR